VTGGPVAQMAMGAFTGGAIAELTGGNFVEGFATGLTVSALNHALHSIAIEIQKSKYSITGIFGAGPEGTEGNADLNRYIKRGGGTMFTSTAGEGDSEIIDHILNEYNDGKMIKIFGYSRGAVAAVRISNSLKIPIVELNLYDPVILGGQLTLTGNHVRVVNNYYQRNNTDLSRVLNGKYPTNPFKGSPLQYNEKYGSTIINNVNYTGHYYRDGSLVNHNNIIKHIFGL